ncbi:Glu/Leu/Phe/Val dehydrogenase [Legionella spiritensis]|uniref:NAD-specific glutamate dehydrogenase n=1 Tax=Legionella spiritensis TaxID=452 RepID=A0A0W0YZD6_LEGSP|nr:hypothetical protein [Legionella spiritensis]KTD62200.1 NAD-specific glutamate dehydrogenase [Legionella spiritensis]SNV29232.1 NAD-specific glutamate dehydrogenase [Legionella spiritensis]
MSRYKTGIGALILVVFLGFLMKAAYAQGGNDEHKKHHPGGATSNTSGVPGPNDVYCGCSVCDLKGYQKISNQELLALDVDILVPAALENVITMDNVEDVKAPIILEVANGPVSHEAESALLEKGTIIIPDVIANSGGVIVSYFEWVQNLSGDVWSLDKVNKKLSERIIFSFEQMLANTQDDSLRASAYILALKRIEEAVYAKGSEEYFSGESA